MSLKKFNSKTLSNFVNALFAFFSSLFLSIPHGSV